MKVNTNYHINVSLAIKYLQAIVKYLYPQKKSASVHTKVVPQKNLTRKSERKKALFAS